jgi:hypothetical protein
MNKTTRIITRCQEAKKNQLGHILSSPNCNTLLTIFSNNCRKMQISEKSKGIEENNPIENPSKKKQTNCSMDRKTSPTQI